ncbi:sensor histidine kinase [Streptomyces sp. NPDC053367]|uniref:sensor histidine kinase n=1 Tax=Streptomyces sp. NPDC053367 TaxID=3365700 RepID=UPI0037D19340
MRDFRARGATSTMDGVPEDQTTEKPRTPEPLTQYLQRTVQRVRAFDRRHPLVWDLHLAGFWTTAALIDFTGDGWTRIARSTDVPGGLVLALSLALSVPLLWRRSHPRAVLLLMAPALLANAWTGALLQAALLQLLVVFHIALRSPLRSLWWAAAVCMAPVVLTVVRHPQGPADEDLVPQAMSLLVAAAVGVTVRTRRDYTAALEDRARRLETERDQQARLAAAAERARIAREMHDIIGHNLSVITGLADGGRYAAARSPERAGQALDAIAGTSRQALSELRRLLDVLREDEPEPADLTPQPALTDLDRLLDGVRAAGLPVTTTVEGTPKISPGRQLTLYRVIQEALTNALKHAGPNATSSIVLSYADTGAVTVTVTDTGRGGPLRGNAGRGLTGMRERTALYGGTLEAGPRPHPEQGWRVHLHLPEEPAQ